MDIAPLSLVINQPKVQQRSDIGVNESAISKLRQAFASTPGV